MVRIHDKTNATPKASLDVKDQYKFIFFIFIRYLKEKREATYFKKQKTHSF